MALVGRIFVILFALCLAIFAAGLVWSIGLLHAQWPGANADPVEHYVIWGAAIIASGMTATMLFLPALVAVVLAEALAVRSFLINIAGGVLLALLAYQGVGFGRSYEESIDTAPPLIPHDLHVAAAAGIVFGVVYWLIAGRKAGLWRTRRL
jgi:hypothetical protein